MKMEMNEENSDHSNFSSDSQSMDSDSQPSMDSSEFMTSMSSSTGIPPGTLANLEGLNSGVPTRTTATLTPTTLRSIEQTFIELQCRTEPHGSQAGFVPPPIASVHGTFTQLPPYQHYLTSDSTSSYSQPLHIVSPGPASSSGSSSQSSQSPSPSPGNTAAPKRRNVGGRRPKAGQNLSPEEEERRMVRRERNKMAAARCRKRRLDHTNELVEETEGLERKKKSFQEEIQRLRDDACQLEQILESHRPSCRLGLVSMNAAGGVGSVVGPPRVIQPGSVRLMQPASHPGSAHMGQHGSVNMGQSGSRPGSAHMAQPASRPESPPDVKPGLYPLDPADGVRVKVEVVDGVDLGMGLDNDEDCNSTNNRNSIMLSSANLGVITTQSQSQSQQYLTLQTPPVQQTRPNRPSFLNVRNSQHKSNNLDLLGALGGMGGIDISTPSTGIPFNFDSLMDGGTGLTPQQHKAIVPDQLLTPDCLPMLNNTKFTVLS